MSTARLIGLMASVGSDSHFDCVGMQASVSVPHRAGQSRRHSSAREVSNGGRVGIAVDSRAGIRHCTSGSRSNPQIQRFDLSSLDTRAERRTPNADGVVDSSLTVKNGRSDPRMSRITATAIPLERVAEVAGAARARAGQGDHRAAARRARNPHRVSRRRSLPAARCARAGEDAAHQEAWRRRSI